MCSEIFKKYNKKRGNDVAISDISWRWRITLGCYQPVVFLVSQNDKVQLQVWWIPDNQMKAAILGAQFVDKSYPTVEICASLV